MLSPALCVDALAARLPGPAARQPVAALSVMLEHMLNYGSNPFNVKLMDIKEIPDTLISRLRSGIFAAFIFSFIAVNWKVLFYLAFANTETVEAKFAFFDARTSWMSLLVIPAILGTVLAIALPWLNFFMFKFTAVPNEKRRKRELEYTSARLLDKARLAKSRAAAEEAFDEAATAERARREEELIGQAMRDQQVLEIENEDLKAKLQARLEDGREHSKTKSPRFYIGDDITVIQRRLKIALDELDFLVGRLDSALIDADVTMAMMFSFQAREALKSNDWDKISLFYNGIDQHLETVREIVYGSQKLP